jgi:type VI secretion system protein ImpA
MAEFDLDTLLQPLDSQAPCGADLEYDPAFLALEEAARGRPEQQFGATIIAAQEPDWRIVDEQAAALFTRTKDLRVLMHWLRARTRNLGLRGFATTLPLVPDLLDRYWDHLHPALDAADHNDPTMRLNALAPLADPLTLIPDLRAAPLGSARIGLRVRDVELAFGKALPAQGETAPTPEGATEALRQAEAEAAGLLQAVRQAHEALVRTDALLSQRGNASAPDFRALRQITQCLAEAAARAAGSGMAAGGTQAAPAEAESGAAAPASPPGTLRSREDVLRMLDRVCEWLERHEPSNPAPLLIRRAQRLMTKNFMDIIRDLIPEGVDQVTRIAGVRDE